MHLHRRTSFSKSGALLQSTCHRRCNHHAAAACAARASSTTQHCGYMHNHGSLQARFVNSTPDLPSSQIKNSASLAIPRFPCTAPLFHVITMMKGFHSHACNSGSTASSNITAGPRQQSAHSGKLSNWRHCPYFLLTNGESFKTLPTPSYTQSQRTVILGVTEFA